jgi:hypothetical protein
MVVQSQPRKIVCETLSGKKSNTKRAGDVAQGVGPEFKIQYHKKNLKKKRDRLVDKSKETEMWKSLLPHWVGQHRSNIPIYLVACEPFWFYSTFSDCIFETKTLQI